MSNLEERLKRPKKPQDGGMVLQEGGVWFPKGDFSGWRRVVEMEKPRKAPDRELPHGQTAEGDLRPNHQKQ